MKRLVELLKQTDFHAFLFCLMLFLVNWPLLQSAAAGGVKALFVYLYGLWLVLILILFLIQKSLRGNRPDKDRDVGGGG